MDPSMLGPFLWNMLAWLAWGVLILSIRFFVEREHQRIAAAEAHAALEAR
jgi:heme exporter protein C